MKFRNPETGEVFGDIVAARFDFCNQRCRECPISCWNNEGEMRCDTYCHFHPQEAANLMGYEFIREPGVDFPEPEYNPDEVAFKSPDQQAKADAGKPRPTLVPVSLIDAVTAVRMYGNQKYHDPENWRQVEPQRYRDALYRHWLAYLKGEQYDPESGLPHLWHLVTNAAFLIEMEGRE